MGEMVSYETKAKFEDLRTENVALRAALKPFADLALWHDTYPDGPDILSSGDMMTQYITADMVRAARKATAAREAST